MAGRNHNSQNCIKILLQRDLNLTLLCSAQHAPNDLAFRLKPKPTIAKGRWQMRCADSVRWVALLTCDNPGLHDVPSSPSSLKKYTLRVEASSCLRRASPIRKHVCHYILRREIYSVPPHYILPRYFSVDKPNSWIEICRTKYFALDFYGPSLQEATSELNRFLSNLIIVRYEQHTVHSNVLENGSVMGLQSRLSLWT